MKDIEMVKVTNVSCSVCIIGDWYLFVKVRICLVLENLVRKT